MDFKTIKLIESELSDRLDKELSFNSMNGQNGSKSEDISSGSESEIYLDLLSKAFVVLDIKSNQLSPIEESIVVSDRLVSISKKLELKRNNKEIDKSLIQLKSNVDFLEKRLNESMREQKSQLSFESEIMNKIVFYSDKRKEYYESIKSKENCLSKVGFNERLTQESIQVLKESNEELRNRLNDINARLHEYKEFIPTEGHLKNKINEMKQQINEFDNFLK